MSHCIDYKYFTKQSGELTLYNDVQEDDEQESRVPLSKPTEESDPIVIEQRDNARERQLETASNSSIPERTDTIPLIDQGLSIPSEIPLSSSSTEGTSTVNDDMLLQPIMEYCCQVSPHLSEQGDDGNQ